MLLHWTGPHLHTEAGHQLHAGCWCLQVRCLQVQLCGTAKLGRRPIALT
jgi:hypothetical protein